MNLHELVDWGIRTLALMDDRSRMEQRWLPVELVRTKLGWLDEFRASLAEWSGYLALINGTLDLVRCGGLTNTVGRELEARLPPASGRAGELREPLIGFLVESRQKFAMRSGCRGRRKCWSRASGS